MTRDRNEADRKTARIKARREARRKLGSPQFFCEVLAALRKVGLVGEQKNGLAVFVVAISRLLEQPLNLFVKGSSSAGKNHLVRSVLQLFPGSAIHELTGASDAAWSYLNDSFSHKVVYLQEESVAFDGRRHPARLLISENRLVRMVAVRSGRSFTVERQETKGPVACIATTTRDRLQVDDENRHLTIWVDETPKQTARILQAQLEPPHRLGNQERRVWYAVQYWLRKQVQTPIRLPHWFEDVVEEIRTDDIRVRRYFRAFVRACETICLIRSLQKKRRRNSRFLMVSLTDYIIASLIFGDAFDASLGRQEVSSAAVRECVARISARKHGGAVRVSEVARELNLPPGRAYAQVRQAVHEGAIRRVNGPIRANLKLYLPAEHHASFLPEPEKIVRKVLAPGQTVRFVHPITGRLVSYRT